MELKTILIQGVLAFVLFLVIDFIWIGVLAKNFYMQHMAELIVVKDGQLQVNFAAAFFVYIFLSAGVVFFALPLANPESLVSLFAYGFLLGFLIYGTYDMTNMATLKSWPLILALVDMFWGATLCGTVSVLTRLTSKLLI